MTTTSVGIRLLEKDARVNDRQILHRVHAKIVGYVGHELTQGELIAATQAMARRMGWVPA